MISRKDFLKKLGLGLAGLSVGPWLLNEMLEADGFDYENYYGDNAENRLWLAIHAGGGWDPTSLLDPKGDDGTSQRINRFAVGQIQNIGPFKVAPNATYAGGTVNGFATGAATLNYQFFNAYQNNLCVVNGIDFKTNNHEDGPRYIWSGSNRMGTASFAALVAAAYSPSQPLSFISNGGYAETAGLLPSASISNAALIQEIALPNRIYPTSANLSTFFTDNTFKRILRARDVRHDNLYQQQKLPKLRHALDKLARSRIGEQKLHQFIAELAAVDSLIASISWQDAQMTTNSIARQFRIVYAAFKAGITVSATLTQGGFDTHGNHDNTHLPNLDNLMRGLLFIMTLASAEGNAQRMALMVSSDFARTPNYNGGNGKDHWPISSMLVYHSQIAGPKVIGATDNGQRAKTYNGSLVETPKAGGGVELRVSDVQASLRKLAGLHTFTNASASQDSSGNRFDIDDHPTNNDAGIRDNIFI